MAGPKALGIDVSVHQHPGGGPPTINWGAVRDTGIAFVFVRVSIGDEVDVRFTANWNGARSVGLPRAPYHALLPRDDIVGQAHLFARAIDDDPGELPPILDVEVADGFDSARLSRAVELWLVTAEDLLKQRPIIYTGPGFWNAAMLNAAGLPPAWTTYYQLWLAQYPFSRDVVAAENEAARKQAKANGQPAPTPLPLPPLPPMETVLDFQDHSLPKGWPTWNFWQWTGQGSLAGIDGPVDQDIFMGTEAEFQAWAQREMDLRGMPAPVRSAAARFTVVENAATRTAAAAGLLITNQFMINVFDGAARRLGANFVEWMTRAGVSLGAMTNPASNRDLPYTGARLENLPGLSAAERKALVLAFFTQPPIPPMTTAPRDLALSATAEPAVPVAAPPEGVAGRFAAPVAAPPAGPSPMPPAAAGAFANWGGFHALPGLHGPADPGGGWVPQAFEVVERSRVRSIKVLVPDVQVAEVARLRQIPGVTLIVARLFNAQLHERRPQNGERTPEATGLWFANEVAAAGDGNNPMVRARGAGIVLFEVHNEPNLTTEGLGVNWRDGAEFTRFFKTVAAELRPRFPGAQFGFPGLSPGLVGGERQIEQSVFLRQARDAIDAADFLCCHVYWGRENVSLADAVQQLDQFCRQFPGKRILVTEFSNNSPSDSPETKAQEYFEFYQACRRLPSNLGAMFAYALSWRGQDNNQEGWMKINTDGSFTVTPLSHTLGTLKI